MIMINKMIILLVRVRTLKNRINTPINTIHQIVESIDFREKLILQPSVDSQ